MVRKFIQLLNVEVSGLHEAAFLLALFTLGAKALAVIRDRFLAGTFGADTTLDVYYAAFRIPDFIYMALASLVASAVLIPFIAERSGDPALVRRFFSQVFSVFTFAILLVCAVAYFTMPLLSAVAVPGLDPSMRDDLISLSRIMLLSPILLGLSGLFSSVIQYANRFIVYAMAPILYNIGILFGIFFLHPYIGLDGLAYGVALGSLLHMVIQIPALMSSGFTPFLTLRAQWQDLRTILALSLPRTFTLSLHQLTLLALIALASFMQEGSITVFNLAFNLQSVPMSIVGLSYSVAAFPALSRFFSAGKHDEFVAHVVTATRHIIFWSMPLMTLLVVLRAQVVRTILGSGAFDWADTRLTAAVLAVFVLSTVFQSVVLLLVRGYYAAGITKRPLVVNTVSLISIAGIALLLMEFFNTWPSARLFLESLLRVEDIPGSEVLLLPMAFSVGMFINAFVLWAYFKRDFKVARGLLSRTLCHSAIASLASGIAAHGLLNVLDTVFDLETFVGIFSQGLCAGIGGLVTWICMLLIMRNVEIRDTIAAIRHKFWKSKPMLPDQRELS